MAHQRKGIPKIVLLLGIFSLFLASCGPVLIGHGADGTPTFVPYEVWLANSGATDAARTQVAFYGTPTYTPSPTFTPSPTSTMLPTFTPTITPSPTATPFTGYWLVDNKEGKVVDQAEFQPSCDGEWGYPGMDVYHVVNGQLQEKVCSTPWNRPQNMAIKVIAIAAAAVFGFFILMMLGNEFRRMNKDRKRRQQAATSTRQLAAPGRTDLARRTPDASAQTDQISTLIRMMGEHDKSLAEALFAFRRDHRADLRGVRTIRQFAEVVLQFDQKLYDRVEHVMDTRK